MDSEREMTKMKGKAIRGKGWIDLWEELLGLGDKKSFLKSAARTGPSPRP
jgi:hypothetical protein